MPDWASQGVRNVGWLMAVLFVLAAATVVVVVVTIEVSNLLCSGGGCGS